MTALGSFPVIYQGRRNVQGSQVWCDIRTGRRQRSPRLLHPVLNNPNHVSPCASGSYQDLLWLLKPAVSYVTSDTCTVQDSIPASTFGSCWPRAQLTRESMAMIPKFELLLPGLLR